ncbi:MAG: hypothetical protein KKB70_09940 [Proteobacteria bacterium]|nr:hypothetical protein [Pseudomonadota bacterium]MBU1536852.1 hypothetical protein [Myxococcota bacterium]
MKQALFTFILVLLLSVSAQATELCSIGVGYPLSIEKSVIEQVVYYSKQENGEATKALEELEMRRAFFYSTKYLKVEVIKRSGVLVQVQPLGSSVRYWLTTDALRCY